MDHCQALQDQHALTPKTTNHFRAVKRQLDQVCSNINDLGLETDKRQKRQILAAIAVGFTSIFGLYGATMAPLRSTVSTIRSRI